MRESLLFYKTMRVLLWMDCRVDSNMVESIFLSLSDSVKKTIEFIEAQYMDGKVKVICHVKFNKHKTYEFEMNA